MGFQGNKNFWAPKILKGDIKSANAAQSFYEYLAYAFFFKRNVVPNGHTIGDSHNFLP